MVLNKIRMEQATGIVLLPNWPTQPWYPIAIRMLKQDPIHLKPSKDLLHLPSLPEKLHPLSNKLNLMVCLLSGENWIQPSYQLLPKTIRASYREGTVKQYRSDLSRWEKFCESNNLDIFQPGLENAIEFLTEIFNSGVRYSAVNTARSALSSIIILPDGQTFGEYALVRRFLKVLSSLNLHYQNTRRSGTWLLCLAI